jgi:hypothetical protein
MAGRILNQYTGQTAFRTGACSIRHASNRVFVLGAFPSRSAGNRAIRLYLFAYGKKDTASIPCAEEKEKQKPPRFARRNTEFLLPIRLSSVKLRVLRGGFFF